MTFFAIGIKPQVEDWKDRGIIDERLAGTLLQDIEDQKGERSFGSIAILLGVVCLCFGVISFVASNWDVMSRFSRLIVLVSAMAGSYLAAAAFASRGRDWFAESFVLLGCVCFGGTVMFVGQMYHLPGHASGAIMVWSLGTILAAGLTRSIPALILGTALATLWSCWFMLDSSGLDDIHLWYLPVWGGCAALAWVFASRSAAHICALGLHAWYLAVLAETGIDRQLPYLVAMAVPIALVGISALLWSKDTHKLLKGFELPAVFHLVFFVLVQTAIWFAIDADTNWFKPLSSDYMVLEILVSGVILISFLASLLLIKLGQESSRFDHKVISGMILLTGLCLVFSALNLPFAVQAYLMILSVWIIRMGNRHESLAITRLGYAAFIISLLMIYSVAAGGLLGTSLFYIIAGLLLVAGALIAPKLAGNRVETGASA